MRPEPWTCRKNASIGSSTSKKAARLWRTAGRQLPAWPPHRAQTADAAGMAAPAEGRIRGFLLDFAAGAAEGLERAPGIAVGPSRQFVKADRCERERGKWGD